MPFTRKRKTHYKKSNRVKPKVSALVKVDRKVETLKRKVKSEQEIRYLDGSFAGTYPNTGVITLINPTIMGDTVQNREGNMAVFKKIKLKGNMVSADPTNIVRLMLVVDFQANGAAPLLGDILDSIGAPVFAYRNKANIKRFSILYDRYYSVVQDNPQKLWAINVSTNIKTNYSLGNTGTISDISRGAIYFVIVTDSSLASHPALNVQYRLKFAA